MKFSEQHKKNLSIAAQKRWAKAKAPFFVSDAPNPKKVDGIKGFQLVRWFPKFKCIPILWHPVPEVYEWAVVWLFWEVRKWRRL